MHHKARSLIELPIAIKKSDLSPEEYLSIFRKDLYASLAASNRRSVDELLAAHPGIDATLLQVLRTGTRVNGALDMRNMLVTGSFFERESRRSRAGMYSRGYTYLVSRDVGLTAEEKLSIYRTDLFDALPEIAKCESQAERFVVSDYVKNSLITMLNALLSEEKVGRFHLDDEEYQNVRSEFIELAAIATRAHYGLLFADRQFHIPEKFTERADSAITYLENRSARRWSRLHGASLSRPEASHPLVIFYAAAKIASAFPSVQVLLGLPSGGTELAFL